ncbi:uncharacterized protein C8Q71DRAFT_717665 [Rhodofomes roseus]|uniref:Reverse transcriptase zinc-binding domain-containing protein n=1 Tax=Rhodofomes roseus TaxID=34475 RepID=A0ABQ8K089_9APHY|nr:uncharacterized protein C8Q71DRAFT_717665 [Rhodofomes roseus]KAH9830056.1 hypothetical protein C8Q71DRAFT_717665 [Rhodofomes roseus]
MLIDELEKWEDTDWRGIGNREAWKALVNVLRQRCAITTFRKAKSKIERQLMTKGRSTACQWARITRPLTIIPQTEPCFNLSGVRLKGLTQRLAYRMIRTRNHTTRAATERNLSSIIPEIRKPNRRDTSAAELWTSLKSKDIRKTISDYLWKCIHNAHRVGSFWENIPGYEDRSKCSFCDETESMRHILIECQAPGRDTIWDLAGSIWRNKQAEWIRPSYEEILGMGLQEWFTRKNKRRPLAERFWRILISESTYLIWCLRCERTIGHESDPGWVHSEKEIVARWTTLMNRRLHLDMTMTHHRFGRQALRKDLVLGTWRGTLFDEHALPDDWTSIDRVLVGITPFVSDARGEG